MAFITIYITYPGKESAVKIATHLLEQRLIACVNYFPINSSYLWQGDIDHVSEMVTLMKTVPENIISIEAEVTKMHSYEIPCIVSFPTEANARYEAWIQESVAINQTA